MPKRSTAKAKGHFCALDFDSGGEFSAHARVFTELVNLLHGSD